MQFFLPTLSRLFIAPQIRVAGICVCLFASGCNNRAGKRSRETTLAQSACAQECLSAAMFVVFKTLERFQFSPSLSRSKICGMEIPHYEFLQLFITKNEQSRNERYFVKEFL